MGHSAHTMKLMILLLISLLLATSVEAGKKKCTKCTNKFEAAKKKFNKCERKASCPSPPLRGSVCNPPPIFRPVWSGHPLPKRPRVQVLHHPRARSPGGDLHL